MQKKEMAQSKLLEGLFPDQAIREVITRVDASRSLPSPDFVTHYSLLNANKKSIFESGGQACFGTLSSHLNTHRVNAKYLQYKPGYVNYTTWKERIRWVELGLEVGLLPEDQTAEQIIDHGVVLDLRGPEMSIGNLYIQLSFMRWLREAPILVKKTIDLVDNAGRDLWAATAYCHHGNIYQFEHSIFPFTGSYRSGGNYPLKGTERDLAIVMRMHQAVACPLVVDKRLISKEMGKNFISWSWNWQSKSMVPPEHFILTNRWMLLSSEVYPIILGGFDKAKETIKQVQKRSKHVRFE